MRRLLLLVSVLSVAALVPPAAAWAQAPPLATSSAGHILAGVPGGVRVAEPGGAFGPVDRIGHDALAIGRRGDAVSVWYGGGPDGPLLAAYRPPGGRFGAPLVLDADYVLGEDEPAVAVDAAGTVVVGFRQGEVGPMVARIRDPVEGWLPKQRLGGINAFGAKGTTTDGGLATIVWRQDRDPRGTAYGTEIAVATRQPGAAAFDAPVVLARREGPSSPVLATNERGDGVVLWIQSRDADRAEDLVFTVDGAFRAAGGSFGRPVRIARQAAGPSAAVLPSGRMVLAWTDYGSRAGARIRTERGALRPPATLTRNPDGNFGVTALAVGQGAAAWSHREPGLSMMRIAEARADGRFARPLMIDRVRGFSSFLNPPTFLTLPSGLFYVRAINRNGPYTQRVTLP